MPEDGFESASSEQTEARLTAVLGSLEPDEAAALAPRLDDPIDPLGRRFAWLPSSIRHRLRADLHHRRGRATLSPDAPAASDADATIQRHELAGPAQDPAADPESTSIPARAAQGVVGAGGALPHQEAIQRAFGRHDVSHVRAHTGRAAATAAKAIGAEAYATGSDIAFARAPDLHLAAHEAAHVVQQRSGVQLAGGVGRAGDPYEQHADQVADRVVQGLSAESLLDRMAGATPAGPSVQRRGGDEQPDARDPSQALRQELGVSITTAPAVGAGQRALVGGRIEFGLTFAHPPRDRTVRARAWGLDLPGGAGWRQLPTAPTTTLPITKPGAHRFWVQLDVDGTQVDLDHRFEAIEPSDRADELLAAQKGLSLDQLRGQLALQQAILRPPGPDEQASPGALRIQTSATNPARHVERDVSLLAYWIEGNRAGQGTQSPIRHHWYARPLRWEAMPPVLGGHPRVSLPEGGEAYDLGTAPVATLSAAHAGTFLILCRVDKEGEPPSDARYLQSILGDDETKATQALVDQAKRTADLSGRLEGETVPVIASHVTVQTGAETTLRLYLGRAKADPDRWLLLDMTPGLDPEHHELEYEGTPAAQALTAFEEENRYPEGAISLRIDPNPLGVLPQTRRLTTDGQTLLGNLSGKAGMASLLMTVGAIAAAPFTGGGSLLVTTLIIGATAMGAAAGALSLADHLKTEKVSQTSIALDLLTIATSFLNAGLAARAIRHGPALLVAGRATRFLLWTNLALEGASGLLVGIDGADQIVAILESKAPPEEKSRLLVAVIANLILTGGMLVISYGDLQGTRGRIRRQVGEGADGLGDPDGLSLALLDDGTMRSLHGASAGDLECLAAILREDPSSLGRITGRGDLLVALRLARGGKAMDLELVLARLRLERAGLREAEVERRIAAIQAEAGDAASVPGLTDQALERRSARRREPSAKTPERDQDSRPPQGKCPPGLPPELEDVWSKLPPGAQESFGRKWKQIAKGNPEPTPRQIESLRSYLDNLAEKHGGNLGAGLEATAKAAEGDAARKANQAKRSVPDPPPTSSRRIEDARQWVEAELERRAISDPMFADMEDQTASKVKNALHGDPIAKAGRATQQATETWSIEGAGGNPREFANRYEYARARYLASRDEALETMRGTPGANAKASQAAADDVSPEKLSILLEQDNRTVRELGPGQHLRPLAPGTSPEEIAERVQRLDRISYESETAESYHAIKHQKELPQMENPTGNAVRDAASAAMDTIRTGTVVVVKQASENSTLVVIRKAYRSGRVRLNEAIIYVRSDGTVVLASYGEAKVRT